MRAPSLLAEGRAGLSRIAAAEGVLHVRLSERTANFLIEFDHALIDEPSLLSLIAGEPTAARAGRVRRSPPPTDQAPESGWLRARCSETIDARAAECVAALLEFERYPEWQAHITSVTVLERDKRGRGSRVTTRGRIGECDTQFTASYQYPSANRVVVKQVDGQLDAVRGSWTFRSVGGGCTRATYLLEVKPGWRLGTMLRGGLYEQIRDAALDHIMSELRERVERRAG